MVQPGEGGTQHSQDEAVVPPLCACRADEAGCWRRADGKMRTISLERLQIPDTATARTALCQMSAGQEMRASSPRDTTPRGHGWEWGGLQNDLRAWDFAARFQKGAGPPGGGQGATPCLLQCAGGLETIPKWWPMQRQW